MNREYFSKHIAPTLPSTFGIYKYYDKAKKLLYVGKAKNIKKRVSSYFYNKDHDIKTHQLVQKIESLEYIITNDEHDAFLLENSLIKHFKPPYNIALKDDKSYAYVVTKNEHFPRIFITRHFINDGSKYIGPFTSLWRVRELLNIIKENYHFRTCKLDLSPEKIKRNKYKVCLEYHLRNCKGPCEGLQSESEYLEMVKEARSLLKGNLKDLLKNLNIEMAEAASQLKFEKAAEIKNRIDSFEKYQAASTVVLSTQLDIDVCSILDTDNYAFINYLVVTKGMIINSKNLTVEKKLSENLQDILPYCISHLREALKSPNKQIVVPFSLDIQDPNINYVVPISGDKKKLLDLSFKNANYFKEEQIKKRSLSLKNTNSTEYLQLLENIAKLLKLDRTPLHIECFDNSNFQGSFPVAAMVCFKNGLPFKKEYRHFHIKTVQGIDDFASMKEIVYRRYRRLLDEDKPLPDLIIIDGGKGQLGSAMKSIIELGLENKVNVVGLAKREELIFKPGSAQPIQIDFKSQELNLIRRIRDEVHRFGITFHRDVRSKKTIGNALESIKGIGEKTAMTLLNTYRSVENIKSLTIEQLTETVGKQKASIVYNHFHSPSEN